MDSETLNEQWARICAQVKSYQDIDPSQVSAFFSRLVPQAMSDSFLMLTADNDFIKTWIERHYVEFIKRALSYSRWPLPSILLKSSAKALPWDNHLQRLPFRHPHNRCRHQHLRSQRQRRWSLSPLSPSRHLLPHRRPMVLPCLRRPPSNHPAWSLIPS